MKAISEAIEGAAAFKEMMRRTTQADEHSFPNGQGSERQPGENRVMHRARLKLERRQMNSKKVNNNV